MEKESIKRAKSGQNLTLCMSVLCLLLFPSTEYVGCMLRKQKSSLSANAYLCYIQKKTLNTLCCILHVARDAFCQK